MSVFDWFQPQEPDTTTFEVSNDDGDQIVFTIPTKGSNKIRQALRNAGLARDKDYVSKESLKDFIRRDHGEHRWWAQRDVDEQEDIEWQGDQEGGPADDEDDDTEGCDYAVDDEASEQTALRFWPKW